MTRKDYRLLAQALATGRPDKNRCAAWAQWSLDVGNIARALARDNVRFDSARFSEACLVEHDYGDE